MAKNRKKKSQIADEGGDIAAKSNTKEPVTNKKPEKGKPAAKSKDDTPDSNSSTSTGCSIPFGKIFLFTSILTLVLAIAIPFFAPNQLPSTITPKFKVIPPEPYPSSKSEEVVTEPSVEDLDYLDEEEDEEVDDDDKPLSLEENLGKIKLVAAPKKKLNFSPHKKKLEEEVKEEEDDDEGDDGGDDDEEDEEDVNELLQKNIKIQKQSSYKAQAIRQKIPNQEAAKDEGFVEVSEGVMKKVIVEGVGNPPSKGDFVSLHCVGYMDDTEPPTQFWNTKELGQRIFTFAVGKKQVIKGWDESVATMKLSEISHVKISAQKAYGKYGFEAWGIPPDVDLLMEFEVMDIKRRRSTD